MYLWTSEAVSAGHPDKVADQIADAILDSHLAIDPDAKVACEITLTKDLVLVTGEITSAAEVDYDKIVRNTLVEIGYDSDESSYNGNTIPIQYSLNKQSREIAQAVLRNDGEMGAGDQGIMFGYACSETANLVPFTHYAAFEYIKALRKAYEKDEILLPDAKTQVSAWYSEDHTPWKIDTVVISTQHVKNITLEDLRDYISGICQSVSFDIGRQRYYTIGTDYLINPAGCWNIGGPASDTGLSGRKIVVDNYGADCPIGGGSFSGKDPSKVDRSGAYICRYIAKNIVANQISDRCQVQISYAIGIPEPLSFRINTFSGDHRFDRELETKIKSIVGLKPREIIERFDLKRPIYKNTASGGHFGRDFPWEKTDLKI